MNKDKQITFNTISNIFILSILFFGGVAWADTNGVWHWPEDVRPGVFGTDEGGGNWSFPQSLGINMDTHENLNENLYVNGSAYFRSYISSNSIFNFLNSGFVVANQNMYIDLDNDNNDANSEFHIRSGTEETLFYVEEAGDVGIGTTNPDYKLDVSGDVNASDYYRNGENLDSIYVNEGQSNSITGNMIVDGTIKSNDIDTSQVQRRVGDSCGPGSSIRSISSNGDVTCENDDVGAVQCRICSSMSGGSQCGGGGGCSGWSGAGSPGKKWTPSYWDDTDDRPGGCTMKWAIECR